MDGIIFAGLTLIILQHEPIILSIVIFEIKVRGFLSKKSRVDASILPAVSEAAAEVSEVTKAEVMEAAEAAEAAEERTSAPAAPWAPSAPTSATTTAAAAAPAPTSATCECLVGCD
jgi:hypothetical protein